MDKKEKFEQLPETKIYNDSEIRFDLNSLEESNFKKMVKYLNDITMAPLEFVLTVSLCALSGAVGKNVYWNFTKSFRVYLNIWAVICGISTISKKTSAIQIGLHDIFRIDELLRHNFKAQKELYDREIKTTNSKEQITIPKPVRDFLVLPNDVTVESLSEILSTSKRGIMFHSEFGSFLAQLDRSYTQGAKMVLTDLYDVPHTKEITRKSGNTFIERPYFSMIGASTLEWIRSNSNQDDLRTGFFSRILFSIRNKNEKPLISVFDLEQLTFRSKYYFDTRSVYDFLTSINEETILTATKEAKAIYKTYEKEAYLELMNKIENNDELSFKGRLIIYTLKFAGVMALSENRFEVNGTDMRNAITVAGYFKRNIEKLINDELITKSDFAIKESKIFEKIKRMGTISRVDLLQSNIANGKKELDPILENLIEKELIEFISISKGKGKASRSYKYKTPHT